MYQHSKKFVFDLIHVFDIHNNINIKYNIQPNLLIKNYYQPSLKLHH